MSSISRFLRRNRRKRRICHFYIPRQFFCYSVTTKFQGDQIDNVRVIDTQQCLVFRKRIVVANRLFKNRALLTNRQKQIERTHSRHTRRRCLTWGNLWRDFTVEYFQSSNKQDRQVKQPLNCQWCRVNHSFSWLLLYSASVMLRHCQSAALLTWQAWPQKKLW